MSTSTSKDDVGGGNKDMMIPPDVENGGNIATTSSGNDHQPPEEALTTGTSNNGKNNNQQKTADSDEYLVECDSSSSNSTQQQQPHEEQDQEEEEEDEITRHWKNSPYAVGRVKKEWIDELECYRDEFPILLQQDDAYAANNSFRMILSGCICGRCLHAGRVGNMAILCKMKEKLICMAGPYWIVPLCITAPLIGVISLAVALLRLHLYSESVKIAWICCTSGLFLALCCVSLNNPGILRRTREPKDDTWIWSSQAESYRPPKAHFDRECAAVIEGFDHVCPWTGTAIGARNMPFFQCFLFMICTCLIFDVILIAFGGTFR